jgi:hypothetical protein
MLDASSSLEDVAYAVCSALHRTGVIAVLSGGGAATAYAPEAYQSRDLDFILQFAAATFAPSAAPLLYLGFDRKGATFVHPDVPFTVEFPAGPLAVGNQIITEWNTLTRGDETLHIITPTDCVRDRLAAAIHWTDFASIDQAVAVARLHPINIDLVESWCLSEGGARQFAIFIRRLHTETL